MSDEEDNSVDVEQKVEVPLPEPEPLPTLPDEIILLNQTHSKYALSIKATPKDTESENAIELDIMAAAFDAEGKLLGFCNNDEGSRSAFNGSFRFSPRPPPVEEGDEGQDEINIDLNNIPSTTRAVYYMVTSFEGSKLSDAENVVVTYTNMSSGEEVVSYTVEVPEDTQTCWVVGMIQRAAHQLTLFEYYRRNEKLTKEVWEETVPDFAPMVKALPELPSTNIQALDFTRQPGFGGSWSGRALNPAQRSQLAGAMLTLQTERNLPTLYHWGTIYGPTDYTILVSVEVKRGIKKRFFYSQGDKDGQTYRFFELPILDDFIRTNAPLASGLFRGYPGFVLPFPADVKKPGDEEDLDDMPDDEMEEEDSAAMNELSLFSDRRNRKLLEVERLAYVVRTIDDHTSLVPRGRYRMTPLTDIQLNPSFQGLSLEEAQKLRNYLHFRLPVRPETLKGLRGPMTSDSTSFLDHLGLSESIRGLWSVQTNFEQTEVRLRSLFCPGAEFTLQVDSPNGYGGVYQGYGDLNHSLVFMLPQV